MGFALCLLLIFSASTSSSSHSSETLIPLTVSLNEAKSDPAALVDETSEQEKAIDPDIHREYYLKAAFLRFIAKFIKWPDSNKPDTEIRICLYGDVPSLKGINSINGRLIQEKTLNVRRITSLDIAKKNGECHILFVSVLVKDQYQYIADTMKGYPVVTFGDSEQFSEVGGCMGFYIVNNRMAIMINTETMAKNDLALLPEVLKLITIIPKASDVNF